MGDKINTRALTALIILLGLTSPLSTDMCLPALPTIAAEFGVSYSQANLLIISFYLFLAITTLLAGPLSDRFGRKKTMLVSLTLFVLGNLGCAASTSLPALIACRSIGACGAGGMLNSSTALTKDVFSGRARDFTLHFVQAFQVLGPLLAPSIGAFLLNTFNWNASFIALACIGVTEAVLALVLPETQPPAEAAEAASIKATFKALPVIMRNRNFAAMLLTAGLLQTCFMAYLATSSYIYTVNFGVSTYAYGIFFGVCGLTSLLAPVIYLKILYDRFGSAQIYRANQLFVLCGGVYIAALGLLWQSGAFEGSGYLAPVLFMCGWAVIALNNAIARPLSTSLLLRQHEGNTGSLSALINFGLYIVSLIGLLAGSAPWSNYVLALGGIIVVFISCAIALFARLTRRGSGFVLDEEKG